MKLDIICDVLLGDTGKGRVCAALINRNKYDFCARGQGGQNAGHQILIGDTKVTTNIVPSGALFGVPSIIGSECYINEKSFFDELDRLSKVRPDIAKLVKISHAAHIVTDQHIAEEAGETKIGSTRRGIGPCARDKFARTGKRAETSILLKDYVVDTYQEFYVKNPNANILFEGAQGFYLDISHGDYPYVTSSYCSVGGILNNGFNHKQVNKVYGVIKGYTTYVGSKVFQDYSDPNLEKLAVLGNEYGSVTGRKRQVNYLDLNMTSKALQINGVDHLFVNKMDILREANIWKVIKDGKVIDLENEDRFIQNLNNSFKGVQIELSYSANHK